MGGCQGRALAVEQTSIAEVAIEHQIERQIERDIEAAVLSYESRLAPIRLELAQLRGSYQLQLAHTSCRWTTAARGSRLPLVRCEQAIADAERRAERCRAEMRTEIAALRQQQRCEIQEGNRDHAVTRPSTARPRWVASPSAFVPVVPPASSTSATTPAAGAGEDAPLSPVSSQERAATHDDVLDGAEVDDRDHDHDGQLDDDEAWAEMESRRRREEMEGQRLLMEERQSLSRRLQQARAERAHERILERARQNEQQQRRRQQRQQRASEQQPSAWREQRQQRAEDRRQEPRDRRGRHASPLARSLSPSRAQSPLAARAQGSRARPPRWPQRPTTAPNIPIPLRLLTQDTEAAPGVGGTATSQPQLAHEVKLLAQTHLKLTNDRAGLSRRPPGARSLSDQEHLGRTATPDTLVTPSSCSSSSITSATRSVV